MLNQPKSKYPAHHRTRFFILGMYLFALLIIARLFYLMVWQNEYYTARATGLQTLEAKLFPERGEVFIQDSRTGEEFGVALNKEYFIIHANTRLYDPTTTSIMIADKLAEVFAYTAERKEAVVKLLQTPNDPFVILEQKVEKSIVDTLTALNLPGIGFQSKPYRYYPEDRLGAHVIGFVGKDEEGNEIGNYGIEGYWNSLLTGKQGFLATSKSAAGRLLPLTRSTDKPAEDGADILLTLDRTVQFYACKELYQAFLHYQAKSAALILMDPKTGKIRALCSFPDFDPNKYNEVSSIETFNNTAIFAPYEPGSVVKPLIMAAALNEGVVSQHTVFHDSGSRDGLCNQPITNAENKSYGDQTMSGVIEKSINTGMVFTVEQLGKQKLKHYFEQYGFGVKEGIELDTENTGTIHSLSEKSGDAIDCYAANAAFGQGFTVTPLQMVTAFSSIANRGKLMKPMIIEEIRYIDGKIEKRHPEEIRQILEEKIAAITSGILVQAVERGFSFGAKIPDHYVAGKTGTAQIAGKGGYIEATNHSFLGFAPADDPIFVMLVKFEKPKVPFASSTAAPVFGKIAKFVLEYYHVAPTR